MKHVISKFVVLGILALIILFGKSALAEQVAVYDAVDNGAGQILVGGDFSGHIATLNSDLVEVSGTQSTFDGVVSVMEKFDGELFIGGSFKMYGQHSAAGLIKFQADGSIDQSFMQNIGSGFDGPVHGILQKHNGQLWVAGEFKTFNGQSARSLVHLNADGSLAASFDIDGPVYDIQWVGGDAYIAVSGEFSKVGSYEAANFSVVRVKELLNGVEQ